MISHSKEVPKAPDAPRVCKVSVIGPCTAVVMKMLGGSETKFCDRDPPVDCGCRGLRF